jgi:DNA repair protein RecO (recombination protein O)
MSSPAIMLRTTEHGDYDKIVTFFALEHGKISLIAKGAQKSIKRFAGVLELFSALNLVWTRGRSRGLAVLQEASVVRPFEHIRTNITHTAYASYWCELVYRWMEEGQIHRSVYKLLEHSLDHLDSGKLPEEMLHITFQLHFMQINGFGPNLDRCINCHTPVDQLKEPSVVFKVKQGGISCQQCGPCKPGELPLSKGTIKHLNWVLGAPPEKLHRIKFSKQAIEESRRALEAFVPCHLGKETKSLKLLKQLVRQQTPQIHRKKTKHQ